MTSVLAIDLSSVYMHEGRVLMPSGPSQLSSKPSVRAVRYHTQPAKLIKIAAVKTRLSRRSVVVLMKLPATGALPRVARKRPCAQRSTVLLVHFQANSEQERSLVHNTKHACNVLVLNKHPPSLAVQGQNGDSKSAGAVRWAGPPRASTSPAHNVQHLQRSYSSIRAT
jgi:hypothetical protein